jgi:hypothetical protein
MKTIILTLTALLTLNAEAQLSIKTVTDEMTGDKKYYFSEQITQSDDEGKGIAMLPFIGNSFGKNKLYMIFVKWAGLNACNEGNTLTFLFEDGSNMSMNNLGASFNCDSECGFTVLPKHKKKLSIKKVLKVQFMNGRSYEKITIDLEHQEYFIEAFKLVDELNNK